MDDVINGSDAQSGLDGLLAETQYQTESLPNEPQSDNGNTADSHEGLSPESSNSAEQPPVTNEPGSPTADPAQVVTAGTQNNEGPPVDPEVERIRAENAQLLAWRENVQRQQAIQQEQAFQAQLAEMTPEERTIALQARQLQRLQAQQMQTVQQTQQAEAARQEMAKQTLAAVMISEYGLPPFAQGELLLAATPEQMEQAAQRVKQQFEAGYTRIGQQQPQAAQPVAQAPQQQQVDPYAAGGAAGGTLQLQPPEIGSGDLDAILNNAKYEVKQQF